MEDHEEEEEEQQQQEEPDNGVDDDPDLNSEYPPGYRFKPHDHELISSYLTPKLDGQVLPPGLIHDVELYKYTPDQLSGMFPSHEGTWYFFTPRDRKYRNGHRPNRSVCDGVGYWKATGADKQVMENNRPVGTRKTLVFYVGRAPRGEKSNWIMQEYQVINDPATRTGDNDTKEDQLINDPATHNGMRENQLINDPATHGTGDNSMRLNECVLCRIHNKMGRAQRETGVGNEQETHVVTGADNVVAEETTINVAEQSIAGELPSSNISFNPCSHDHMVGPSTSGDISFNHENMLGSSTGVQSIFNASDSLVPFIDPFDVTTPLDMSDIHGPMGAFDGQISSAELEATHEMPQFNNPGMPNPNNSYQDFGFFQPPSAKTYPYNNYASFQNWDPRMTSSAYHLQHQGYMPHNYNPFPSLAQAQMIHGQNFNGYHYSDGNYQSPVHRNLDANNPGPSRPSNPGPSGPTFYGYHNSDGNYQNFNGYYNSDGNYHESPVLHRNLDANNPGPSRPTFNGYHNSEGNYQSSVYRNLDANNPGPSRPSNPGPSRPTSKRQRVRSPIQDQ